MSTDFAADGTGSTTHRALENVRFGSKADMCGAKRYVRFAPESDRESRYPKNREERVAAHSCADYHATVVRVAQPMCDNYHETGVRLFLCPGNAHRLAAMASSACQGVVSTKNRSSLPAALAAERAAPAWLLCFAWRAEAICIGTVPARFR